MPTKTNGSLFALAEVTINTVTPGSDYTIPTGAIEATVRVDFAQTTTMTPASAAPTGTRVILQGSDQASGTDSWVTIADFISGTNAAESEAITGTQSAGATTLTVASTTNLGARSEDIFIKNATLANSEWATLKSIVINTSVTLVDAITNAQTGSTIYDQALHWIYTFPTTGIKRVRLLVDNNYQATGPTVAVRASITTYEA